MRKNSFSCVITVLKFQLLLRELCHSEIAETDALSSFIGASFRLNALGAKIKSVELLQNTGIRRSGEIDPSRNRKVGKALSESGFEGGNLYFPYVRFNPSSISKDDVHEQTSSSSTRPKLPTPSKINAPISDSDRASLTDLLSNPHAFPLSLITRKNCQHPDHLVLTAAAGDRMGVSAADIEKKAYSLWRRVALYNAAIDPAGVDGAKCLLACGSEAPHCLAACHRERARKHGWARETPTLDEAACTRACGPFAPKCVSVCTTSRKLVHRDAPEPSVDEQDCDAECGPASSPACRQSCALERAAVVRGRPRTTLQKIRSAPAPAAFLPRDASSPASWRGHGYSLLQCPCFLSPPRRQESLALSRPSTRIGSMPRKQLNARTHLLPSSSMFGRLCRRCRHHYRRRRRRRRLLQIVARGLAPTLTAAMTTNVAAPAYGLARAHPETMQSVHYQPLAHQLQLCTPCCQQCCWRSQSPLVSHWQAPQSWLADLSICIPSGFAGALQDLTNWLQLKPSVCMGAATVKITMTR